MREHEPAFSQIIACLFDDESLALYTAKTTIL